MPSKKEALDLVSFLVAHGYNREEVLGNIDKWLERQDRMDSYSSFKEQIILAYKKKIGEKLSKKEEKRLEELNFHLMFLDPLP